MGVFQRGSAALFSVAPEAMRCCCRLALEAYVIQRTYSERTFMYDELIPLGLGLGILKGLSGAMAEINDPLRQKLERRLDKWDQEDFERENAQPERLPDFCQGDVLAVLARHYDRRIYEAVELLRERRRTTDIFEPIDPLYDTTRREFIQDVREVWADMAAKAANELDEKIPNETNEAKRRWMIRRVLYLRLKCDECLEEATEGTVIPRTLAELESAARRQRGWPPLADEQWDTLSFYSRPDPEPPPGAPDYEGPMDETFACWPMYAHLYDGGGRTAWHFEGTRRAARI